MSARRTFDFGGTVGAKPLRTARVAGRCWHAGTPAMPTCITIIPAGDDYVQAGSPRERWCLNCSEYLRAAWAKRAAADASEEHA